MDYQELTTLYTGSAGNASTSLDAAAGRGLVGTTRARVVRNDILQVVFRVPNVGGGAWSFEYTSIDMAGFPADIRLLSIEKVEAPTVNHMPVFWKRTGTNTCTAAERDLLKYLHPPCVCR